MSKVIKASERREEYWKSVGNKPFKVSELMINGISESTHENIKNRNGEFVPVSLSERQKEIDEECGVEWAPMRFNAVEIENADLYYNRAVELDCLEDSDKLSKLYRRNPKYIEMIILGCAKHAMNACYKVKREHKSDYPLKLEKGEFIHDVSSPDIFQRACEAIYEYYLDEGIISWNIGYSAVNACFNSFYYEDVVRPQRMAENAMEKWNKEHGVDLSKIKAEKERKDTKPSDYDGWSEIETESDSSNEIEPAWVGANGLFFSEARLGNEPFNIPGNHLINEDFINFCADLMTPYEFKLIKAYAERIETVLSNPVDPDDFTIKTVPSVAELRDVLQLGNSKSRRTISDDLKKAKARFREIWFEYQSIGADQCRFDSGNVHYIANHRSSRDIIKYATYMQEKREKAASDGKVYVKAIHGCNRPEKGLIISDEPERVSYNVPVSTETYPDHVTQFNANHRGVKPTYSRLIELSEMIAKHIDNPQTVAALTEELSTIASSTDESGIKVKLTEFALAKL